MTAVRDDNDRMNDGEPLDGKAGDEVRALPPRFGELTDGALTRLLARARKEEKPIPVPWERLRENLGGGLWPGMHVLVSGTGAGKTQFALQLALHAAEHGTPVAYVALELDKLQVVTRLLALRSTSLVWSKLYRGEASEENVFEAAQLAEGMADLPLYIEEGSPGRWPASNLEKLAKAMRTAHPEETPGAVPMLIVLDFLQLVGPNESNQRADLRERIGSAAYYARDIASKMNAAVLLVSSTARSNYGLAAGGGDKPTHELHDDGRASGTDGLVGLGKESGEIEYAADSLFVAIRRGEVECDKGGAIAFVTAKIRAGVPHWTAFAFNGVRYKEWEPGYAAMATHDTPPKRSKKSDAQADKQATKGRSGTRSKAKAGDVKVRKTNDGTTYKVIDIDINEAMLGNDE